MFGKFLYCVEQERWRSVVRFVYNWMSDCTYLARNFLLEGAISRNYVWFAFPQLLHRWPPAILSHSHHLNSFIQLHLCWYHSVNLINAINTKIVNLAIDKLCNKKLFISVKQNLNQMTFDIKLRFKCISNMFVVFFFTISFMAI